MTKDRLAGTLCRAPIIALLASGADAAGQIVSSSLPAPDGRVIIDGPPPPPPPAIVARDETGRATLRAVRVEDPMRIDGTLDERVYVDTPSASGFVQAEPRAGEPATEQTEVWVLFDDDNLYHGEHRLCAGRGRRTAGKPDALQSVLSGKA